MGGVEQVIHQTASTVKMLGGKIYVLSITRERVARTIKIHGYLLHRVRLHFQIASASFFISAFLRFAQSAKKADVIFYHFPWPFMDVVHFAMMVKKPTVVTHRCDIIRQMHLQKIGALQASWSSAICG